VVLPQTARANNERKLPQPGLEVDTAQCLDARAIAEVLVHPRHEIAMDWFSRTVHPRNTAAASNTMTRLILRRLAMMTTNRMQPPVSATLATSE